MVPFGVLAISVMSLDWMARAADKLHITRCNSDCLLLVALLVNMILRDGSLSVA